MQVESAFDRGKAF